MPPGVGASPHIHKKLTEMFYVTEKGKVVLRLADKKVNASQGRIQKMLVPEKHTSRIHQYRKQPATLLIMFCPADSREGYFKGMAGIDQNGTRAHQEKLKYLMGRYDQYLVRSMNQTKSPLKSPEFAAQQIVGDKRLLRRLCLLQNAAHLRRSAVSRLTQQEVFMAISKEIKNQMPWSKSTGIPRR